MDSFIDHIISHDVQIQFQDDWTFENMVKHWSVQVDVMTSRWRGLVALWGTALYLILYITVVYFNKPSRQSSSFGISFSHSGSALEWMLGLIELSRLREGAPCPLHRNGNEAFTWGKSYIYFRCLRSAVTKLHHDPKECIRRNRDTKNGHS